MTEPIKIGIGGPVGAGKTQLVERLTRHMSAEISMAAITNDIYTIEDAKILAANGILPETASSASKPAAARTPPSAKTRR
jgi:urease accessory protein